VLNRDGTDGVMTEYRLEMVSLAALGVVPASPPTFGMV
jgi:hypothetical protein